MLDTGILTLSHLSDRELLACLPAARSAERTATAHMIAYLAELDRRRLYLAEACSSLFAFCIERLGYSENEAQKRIQVARLCERLPQILPELENGSIHLTGLFLLSTHLTVENAAALLDEARGRTKREIELVIAKRFPRSDVLPTITPLPTVNDISVAIPGNGSPSPCTPSTPVPSSSRLEPLSAASYRVEFTASAELHRKIERTRSLLSHAVPSGDLALLFERALDTLLDVEMKRRLGAAQPRRQREAKPGPRHVPLDVARDVWQRDAFQCSFTDAQGRRCNERRFITIEHRQPFGRGGPASTDNLCLLCSAHNAARAREEFGKAHVQAKQLEAAVHQKTLCALVELGFERRSARAVLKTLRELGTEPEVDALLRAALALLVPERGGMARASSARNRAHHSETARA